LGRNRTGKSFEAGLKKKWGLDLEKSVDGRSQRAKPAVTSAT
jgi:hypothetical protein